MEGSTPTNDGLAVVKEISTPTDQTEAVKHHFDSLPGMGKY